MDPVTLAILALGGVALLGGKKSASRSGSVASGGFAVRGKADRASMLNEVRNMSFHYSNRFGSMPRLADFLTVTAFRESNFNPEAINPEVKTNPANAARGLFGMRPETAFKESNGLLFMRNHPNALLHPRWAFVCAVDHVWRACSATMRKSETTANFAAVRRWWGWPVLVHDFDLENSKSRASAEKFEKATNDCNRAYGTNINPNFVWGPIQNWENYPGMETMLGIYGLRSVA